jgi:hypothetical protein
MLSRLQSQKVEMMGATKRGHTIVYGYLDESGKLYYVGIGSCYSRAYNRNHGVQVPEDAARVRMLGSFPSRAEAEKREVDLIKRYGRQGVDAGGALLNRSSGGGKAALGVVRSDDWKRARSLAQVGAKKSHEAVAKVAKTKMQKIAVRYGVGDEYLGGLTQLQRDNLARRYKKGLRGERLLEGIGAVVSSVPTLLAVTAERYGVDPALYAALDKNCRTALRKRHKAGMRGAALMKDLEEASRLGADPRLVASAKLLGVEIEAYAGLSLRDRQNLNRRYKAGKRGAELLAGLA